ncbi:MAG: 50S ribosomal protein L23 [Oscillospiraceae bacterium]|nr:50S ribosomal protein L23 [Oscillospiraceae bacterium]
MKTPYDILLRPIITERSMEAVDQKKYVFEVARDANKIEIRKAVEEIFGVTVLSVNTINMQGKEKRQGAHIGRRSAWKKAIIRLRPDSKTIEFFEGMV